MISRARPHFEDDLFAVTERLKLVIRRKEINEDENPLDPKAICECFHKASDLLETDIQVKLIFYKLFEKYVMKNLGHFYKELNEIFVEKGVLPGFKADQERMKQTTRFMANRIKQTPDNTAANSPLAMALGAAASAGMMAGAAGDGNLFAALQQAAAGAPGGGIAAEAGVAGGGVAGGGGFCCGANELAKRKYSNTAADHYRSTKFQGRNTPAADYIHAAEPGPG
jgi:hypothetical protein